MFTQHKRRIYTSTMPEGSNRYQINYILGKKDIKTKLNNESYPGSDVDSNHNPVIMETRLSIKRNTKKHVAKRKWNLD